MTAPTHATGMTGLFLALVIAVGAGHGSAFAATATDTFQITEQVTASAATCSFGNANATIGLVSYSGGALVNQIPIMTITCTNGAPWSIAPNNGLHNANATNGCTKALFSSTASSYLSYELYTDNYVQNALTTANPLTGTGTGAAQSVTVNYVIPAQGLKTEATNYVDTVNFTLSF